MFSVIVETSDGNVGIGTDDPQAKLHVVGNLRLNFGEGFELCGNDCYFGAAQDARILRLIDQNWNEGNIEHYLVARECHPLATRQIQMVTN